MAKSYNTDLCEGWEEGKHKDVDTTWCANCGMILTKGYLVPVSKRSTIRIYEDGIDVGGMYYRPYDNGDIIKLYDKERDFAFCIHITHSLPRPTILKVL